MHISKIFFHPITMVFAPQISAVTLIATIYQKVEKSPLDEKVHSHFSSKVAKYHQSRIFKSS